jgi:uncharacterized delta-60 repeat protein
MGFSALLCLRAICSDGMLDTSFGTNGAVTGPMGFLPSGIRIQPNGKIVVSYTDPYGAFQATRYTTDGSLSTSFGGTGIIFGPAGMVFDTLIQYNDQIVFGGQNGDGSFQLVRYNWDGSVDFNFGSNGLVTGPSGSCAALAQDVNGNIIAAGTDGAGNVLVVRYTMDGTVDTTFDTTDGYAEDVIIQNNGQIVVAGTLESTFLLVRYNTDGTLDSSFGIDGVVTGLSGVGTALLLQADGSLIVGGSNVSNPSNIQIARYSSTGVLDSSFGTDGVVTGPEGLINDMVLQADGSIVIAGQGAYGQETLLMRYSSTGAVDTSFGSDGAAAAYPGMIKNIALQADGYIITLGLDSTYNEIQVMRFVNNQPLTPTELTTFYIPTNSGFALTGSAQNPSNVYLFINNVFAAGVATAPDGSWNINYTFADDGIYAGRVVAINKNAKVNLAQLLPIRVSNT